MLDVLRFWFERGIDGFRIDVLWHLIKDDQLRDNPPNPAVTDPERYDSLIPVYSTDRPEVYEIVRDMRRVADEHGRRLLVGEIYLPVERLVTYYGTSGDGVHLPFNFQLVTLPWDARVLADAIAAYEGALPPDGWPNWVLGNHDQPRIASRVGPRQARVAAMLLLTLRGTPTVYYGDEIGMTDVAIPRDRQVDPAGRNREVGRDPQRTPMQWDPGPGAGFTDGEPWLPVGDDVERVSVAAQRRDPRSILELYRRLIELRRREPALGSGSWAAIEAPEATLAFERRSADCRLLVALNLGTVPVELPAPFAAGEVLLSTGLDREGERLEGQVRLGGDEGLVIAERRV
jgi:alpha-glucosidase